MKKGFKKALLMLLSLVMVFTMMPLATMTAFADDATSAEVTFTLSNQGVLAKATDGTAVVEKPVTVTDLNGDGTLTYDEALAAAHESYNSADGFDCSDSGWVNKIWGEYGSFTFQNNGTALPSVVTQGIVKEGDKLYTAINSDNTLYADWYTSFDNTSITTKNGKEISLVLTGRQGSLDVDARPASGVQIGIWKDGAFEPLDGVKTGEDGKATFTVDLEPGEYILSAKGSVADIVDAEASWTLSKATKDKDGNDIYGKTDWTTYTTYIGYTEKDYEDGPYPWNEIQWIEQEDFDAEEFDDGYLLYSGNVAWDCPITAPYAKVLVEEPSALDLVLDSIGGLSNDPRNFTAADAERVEAIQAAYEALSAEDKATVDSTFNHPSGDGQSYGRILEAAVWTVRSFATDTSTTLAPGTYTTTTEPAVSSSSDKGKSDSSRVRNWVVESVEVSEDGQATAVIYVTDDKGKVVTSYPSVWIGGELYNKDSNNRYTIPIDLNGITYLGGISSSMPRPIMYTLKTEIEEPTLEDGVYTLPELAAGPSAMFNHFEADSRYLVVSGDTATIRFITDGSTASIQKYSRIALGKSSELVETSYQPELPEGTTIIDGVLYDDGSGKEKYLFKVEMPKDKVTRLLANSKEDDIYIIVWNKVGSSAEKIPGWYKPSDDIYLSLGQLGEMTELKNGWKKEDGGWYYYEDGLKVTNTWKKDSKGWVYLGEDGKMVTSDWAKDSKGWVYVGSDGYMVTGTKWMKVDGSWYHITNGYRDQNKWMKDSKGWCYLAEDGKMVTNGWAKDSKGWCYIGSEGYMIEKTQWLKLDGSWYHITKGYRDQNKWMKDSKGWCYLASDGKMVTNDFAKDSKGWCYIGSDGYMVEQTKWIKIGEDWYHITKGYRDQSKWMKDSKGWCYLASDGKMVTNDFAKDSKGYCWIGPEGYMIEETMWIGEAKAIGSSYIINGYRVDNKTIEIDGRAYTFDGEGKLVNGDLVITNTTGMFNVVSAYLQTEGNQEYLVMALNGTGYKELFKGTYEEAVTNGDGSKDKGNDSWIHSYTNEAGKYEFKVPVSADETYIPCVAISNSYYTKYLSGQNPLERAFYPRQFTIDREKGTLVTGDYDHAVTLNIENNVKMFKPGETAEFRTVGGPNSNNYGHFITLTMGSDSFSKVRAKSYSNMGAEFIEKDPVEIEIAEGNVFADIPVLANGEVNVIEFYSVKNQKYYKRDLVIDLEAGKAIFNDHQATVEDLDGMTEDEAVAYVTENKSVDLLNALIEAIQVQYRDKNTDMYCAAAKACWDALPEADQQEDDGYFSDDTGDASLDDPLNTAPDKEKELLVVSFGTSFNGSRVATIGAVEKALAAAYGDEYAVRRAFTAQIIINHVQSRDGEKIDNVKQAMDKAVAAGVKEMIVQPTHLMSGAEYDELKAEIDKYADKINITYGKPLLDSDADKQAVAQAVVAAAVEDAGYASLEAAATDGVAFVFMGHGTSHEANVTYTQMQQTMNTLGYANCFIGTVEGIPEETALPEVKKAVEANGYTKVVLRPLMVVAGDHANNDMAADEEGSWYYAFVNGGEFEVEGKDEAVDIGEGFGAANVTCQINGLGEIAAIQQLYVAHVEAVLS